MCRREDQNCKLCGTSAKVVFKTPISVEPRITPECLPRQSRQLSLDKHLDARIVEGLTADERSPLQTPSAGDDALLDLGFAVEEHRSSCTSCHVISAQSGHASAVKTKPVKRKLLKKERLGENTEQCAETEHLMFSNLGHCFQRCLIHRTLPNNMKLMN